MDKFNIRSIAVLTVLMLICLTGSALAADVERTLGADDPPWVLNPDCETVVVKLSSVNMDLVRSLITVTYKTIVGGVETTSRHPFSSMGRSFMLDIPFSEPGKLVKQRTFDVTRGKLKYEVTYQYFYKCAPGQPGC